MKKKIASTSYLLCALLFLLISLTSCQQVQVSQDYNLDNSPASMRYFSWYPGFVEDGGVKRQDPLLHDRYVKIIEEQLISKGYSKSSNPDFLITYQYQLKTKIHSSPSSSYRFSSDRYGRNDVWGVDSGTKIRQYDVAYLFIDFFAADSKNAFWRGRGSAIATSHSSPETLTQNILKTVSEILSQIPQNQ